MHISQLAVQRDLVFRLVRGVQFIGKLLDLLPGTGRQIDQPAKQVLIFTNGDTSKPPKR